jgi:clorobiocin biosynthesis protein CloN5
MTNDDVANRVAEFIRRELLDGDPRGELTESTPLLEWGVLNSLNTVRLLTFIREDIGVLVPPTEINARNLRNVRAIASMVIGLVDA